MAGAIFESQCVSLAWLAVGRSLHSLLLPARAPQFCGREQDPSWRSSCWGLAQPGASRNPGGQQHCCSMGIHHPSSWGPLLTPALGGPSPAGANSLPCSFSPGVSAEPAGRPGKQIYRQPPQPETSTKQGGNWSGSPPQPCPPVPRATPEPRAPSSHWHAFDPGPGTPCCGHPCRLLPSQHSISRPPAWCWLSFSH